MFCAHASLKQLGKPKASTSIEHAKHALALSQLPRCEYGGESHRSGTNGLLKLLSGLARSAVWLILSFAAVVALLALTAGLPERIRSTQAEAANLERASTDLQARQPDFENDAKSSVAAANREIERVRRAGSNELNEAEDDIAAMRKAAERRRLDKSGIALAALAGDTDKIAASYKAEFIELPLADRALSLIALRRQNLQKIANRAEQERSIDRRVAAFNTRVGKHNKLVGRRNALQRRSQSELRNPLCRRVAVPIACKSVREIKRLDELIVSEKSDLERQRRDLLAARAGLKALGLASLAVSDGDEIAARATEEFRQEAERIGQESAGRVVTIAKNSLRRFGWAAFWIVLAGVLLPVAHKLFAFGLVAPLASRSRPVQIMPRTVPSTATGSHTSIDVPLDQDTELLVRLGVQSTSSNISARDVLVLKKRIPLTCLAAGLVNLQRLRSDRPDYATVTAANDGHAEVALVGIPTGGAVVLQPRALVGVLKRRSDTLRIDRLWRLRFLTSWITCQFRYVVFHGPCTLIVQGTRGVRVEDANDGRMINKRLTLGFDAGLRYGAARSPSFLPYLRGEASLFNDRFTGDGRYLFEQRSRDAAKGTIWGRGLKGLGDVALNALGI